MAMHKILPSTNPNILKVEYQGTIITGRILDRGRWSIKVALTSPYRLLFDDHQSLAWLPDNEDCTGAFGLEKAAEVLVGCHHAAKWLYEQMPLVVARWRDLPMGKDLLLRHGLMLDQLRHEGYDFTGKPNDDQDRFMTETQVMWARDGQDGLGVQLQWPKDLLPFKLAHQAHVLLCHALLGSPVDLRATAQRREVPSQLLKGLPSGMHCRVILN